MAAAPVNVNTLVCFVKVDPSFQVVMNAIAELQRNRRLQVLCTVRVGNNGLRSTSDNQQFGGRNGFARTLGSVLRAFMLRSAYVEYLHDPNFPQSKGFNLDQAANRPNRIPAGYYYVVQPLGPQLPVTQNVVQAQDISANFDSLYPHFLIENKLAAVPQGTWVDLPGMMVIVELQGGVIVKLHTINATVTAKQDPQIPNKFECPDPNVVRITAAVLDLQDGQTDGDFPFFEALKGLLKADVKAEANSMSDEEIEALLKKLRIQEEIEESNKEDGSEKSDDTSSDKPTEEEQPQKSEDK